jgi:hypothetical protein
MLGKKTFVSGLLCLVAVGLIVIFQNCQATPSYLGIGNQKPAASAASETDTDGNGYSYDGKLYKHRKDSGVCSDGATHDAAIVLNASGQYFLTREACAAVVPPRMVSVARLSDPPAADQILFEGRVFEADGPLATPTPAPTPIVLKGIWNQLAATGAVPSERGWHSSVWTGSEMIVWGGDNPNMPDRFKNDGGIFNPVTKVWTAMSGAAGFVQRGHHSAVWTGSKMIVWGGFNGAYRSDGAAYDPVAGTWTSIAASPLSARGVHSAVWTGSEMIVWGGAPTVFGSVRDGAAYNPTTNQWRMISTTGAPSARGGHAAVWTGSKMIVWGGANGAGPIFYNDGAVYDPSTDSWAPLLQTNTPSARNFPTAVFVEGKMILLGGFNRSYPNEVSIYDPTTGIWESEVKPSYPPGRYSHSAVWTGSEMIVWGGLTGGVENTPQILAPTDLFFFQ